MIENSGSQPRKVKSSCTSSGQSLLLKSKLPINLVNLQAAMKELGVNDVAALARLSNVNRRTLVGWFTRPEPNGLRVCLEKVAESLGVSLEYLIKFPDDALREFTPRSLPANDCDPNSVVDGTWVIKGHDIVVPGRFEYAIEAKQMSGRIVLCRDPNFPSKIIGEGYDQDGDPLHFEGTIERDLYVSGCYVIQIDRMRVFGSLFAHFEWSGNVITGHYLTCETGHRVPVVLGEIRMELQSRCVAPLEPPAKSCQEVVSAA